MWAVSWAFRLAFLLVLPSPTPFNAPGRGLRGVMSSPPVVPFACKNLIKDRMERSGMRWTDQMAEAIVQLRAIYLSGDFDRYWQFHIDQDQRRLYPVAWAVVPK